MDREGLWFRVVVARYGLVEGRLQVGGREGSVGWRDTAGIRDGVGTTWLTCFPTICILMSEVVPLLYFCWIGG